MKQYKIFENQAGRREAVKQGWSWPASCFSFIWAFWKRMYATGAILLAAAIVLGILSQKVDELFVMRDKSARSADHLCHLGQWVLIAVMGVNGNELRERNLLARGYEFRGMVAAESPDAALASYREQPGADGGQRD
jgi:hypothetical protein